MKKLQLLTIAVVTSLFFISCSEDSNSNDDDEQNEISIVGTWDAVDIDYVGEGTYEFEGETIEMSFEVSGENFNAQSTFSQNPNELTSSGTYTQILSITAFGQTVTEEQVVDLDSFGIVGSWELNGNILTIDNGEGPFEYEVTTLSEDTLVLDVSGHTVNQDGISVVITNGTTTYSR